MSVTGIDYAFSPHPAPDATKHAGFDFVCRYISSYAPNDRNGKNLLPGEKKELRAAGLGIVLVAEEGAGRMLKGRAAGVTDAKHAAAVTKALGMADAVVFYACDFDATPGQQAAINAYLDGAASVRGRELVGIYGSYYVVKRAMEAGHALWGWQTYAWSGGLVYRLRTLARTVRGKKKVAGAHVYQDKNGIRVAGASVDHDTALQADYGQWPRPKTAKPASSQWRVWRTEGKSSLVDVAKHTGMPVPTILRCTATHYGKFDKVTYKYLKGVFAGRVAWNAKIPAGASLWVKEEKA